MVAFGEQAVTESVGPVPLVVIDDQPVVHAGIRFWVELAAITAGTVLAYSSLSDFLEDHQRPANPGEVIIYDPEHGEQRPDYVGLQQLRERRHRVVAYSRITSAEVILNCLDAGAATYVVKSESPQDLIDAITAAHRGTDHHGPHAAAAVCAAKRRGRIVLSAQERRVLVAWLLTDNKESVSRELFIAPSTVRTHLQRIRLRYNEVGRPAPSKAALFARAVQDGLVGIHDV